MKVHNRRFGLFSRSCTLSANYQPMLSLMMIQI